MGIAGTILRITASLFFSLSAFVNLVNADANLRRFGDWGYAAWAFHLVVAIELICAIGLLIPKTAETAAGGLILLMLGAIYTHFSQGESLVTAAPALMVLTVLAFIVILRRRERSAISL